MLLRKLFNLRTKAEQELVKSDIDMILTKCSKIAKIENDEQYEARKSHDEVCPNCRSRKDKIVNKIKEVKGLGKINNNFIFGFGDVNGSINIETNEINHCNVCGNEWKKYRYKSVGDNDIARVALNYLSDLIINPTKEKEKKWKLEAIKVFEDSYVESIIELCKKNKDYVYSDTIKTIKRKNLSKRYKSIYKKSS